jgi:Zn-dependent peptidase ImmA (M78 family)
MSQPIITWNEKVGLARKAMRAAMDVRFDLGLGLEEPICCYDVCERMGVPVRFVGISMEGVYSPKPIPRILLSALRPLARRHFNCAHELGHHVFGHGSTLDELQEALRESDNLSPEEFIVNSFAGHLLMPVLGIRRAFSRRMLKPSGAQPHEVLAIACEFGVAYDALVTQLAFCLRDINPARRLELLKARPALSRALLPQFGGSVAFLDSKFSAATLDVEENHFVVAPIGALGSSGCIMPLGSTNFGALLKLPKRGIFELFIPATSWTLSIRVTKQNYVGLARFRHLEGAE